MKIVNRALCASFRGRPCEYCGRHASDVVGHHVIAVGIGGGGRLDVPICLVSLCKACHTASHAGNEPTREQLLEIIARREKTTPQAILDELYRLRRMTKEGKEPR